MYEPDHTQVRGMMKTLKAERPIPGNSIQITGGEPMLREDIADVIKIMQEEDEPEGEEIETDDIEVKDDAGVGKEKPITFAPPAQSLGVATVKPDGAATVGVDINITPDKAVSISMNEGEKKLRKYIPSIADPHRRRYD